MYLDSSGRVSVVYTSYVYLSVPLVVGRCAISTQNCTLKRFLNRFTRGFSQRNYLHPLRKKVCRTNAYTAPLLLRGWGPIISMATVVHGPSTVPTP